MTFSKFAKRAALALLVASCALAQAQTLLSGATTTGAGSTFSLIKNSKTFQVVGSTASGTGTAVVTIDCSNNGSNWDVLGSVTLSLATTSSSNSFTSADRCNNHRANVTTLSGTGASVSATAGN